MKGKPIPIGGQAISSVGLPGGGSVTFPDTGSAASFRDYLASTGFTPPSPLALPLQSSLMQQAMGFADEHLIQCLIGLRRTEKRRTQLLGH